jgi:dephospho-CoA kinase
MPVIGITGGISTGKTMFCDCLRELVPAAKFFDADQAARELVDLDPEVKKELAAEFGAGIFSSNGRLNREQLRAIVFQDAAKKSALEQILHPRIRRQWGPLAEKHHNSSQFFFADIPLLYETGGETLCDRVVVVASSHRIQLSRLLERKRIERSAAEEMIKSQMPLAEKISRADHVVWNNDGRFVLEEQAKLLVDLWREESWTKS